MKIVQLFILIFCFICLSFCENKHKDSKNINTEQVGKQQQTSKEFISEIDSLKYFPTKNNFGASTVVISKNRRYLLNICEYTRFQDKEAWQVIKKHNDSLEKENTFLVLMTQGIDFLPLENYYKKKYGITNENIIWDTIEKKLSEVIYYEIIDLERAYKNRIVGKLYHQKHLNSPIDDKYHYQSDTVNNFTFKYWHDSSLLRLKKGGNYFSNKIEKCVDSYLDSTGFYGSYVYFNRSNDTPTPSFRLILDEEVEQNKIINKGFFYYGKQPKKIKK